MKELRVKDWFATKMQDEATGYNTYIDVKYNDEIKEGDIDLINRDGGYITVYVQEEIKETEKAINVVLSTGHVDGSTKGWKTWIPKSVVK